MAQISQRDNDKNFNRLDPLINSLLASKNSEELFFSSCQLASELVNATGVAIFQKNQGKVGLLSAYPFNPSASNEMPNWLTLLGKSYGQMLAENYQVLHLSDGGIGIFVPLFSTAQGNLCIAAHVFGNRQVRLQGVSDTLQLIRTMLFMANKYVEQKENQGSLTTEQIANNNSLQDILSLLGEFQNCTKFSEACITLCAGIAARFSARRVALGAVYSRSVHVIALDQMDSFRRGTRTIRQLESVMEESHDQERIVFYSEIEEEKPEIDPGVIVKSAKELANMLQIKRVFSVPLYTNHDEEKIEFILVCLFDEKEIFVHDKIQELNLIARLVAPRLKDLQLAEEFFLKKFLRYLKIKSIDIFGERRTILKLATAIVGIFLFIGLVFKGDLVISAPLVVEGVHSYTHTAPLDSYLSEVLVRPGDAVKKNDVLGRLDSTQISLEIAALQAEEHIHQSQATQFLQEGNDAEAAIAFLESERTKANLKWAEERLLLTELRSSVDGFLVSEDMYSHLGQPVRRGQALFEITDTSSLRIVAHIDESDISYINTAREENILSGEFTLTAYPSLHIPFAVERIHPYASQAENKNGFELRGELLEIPQSITLRPGMEGFAKIAAGQRSILYLWTRKLINRLKLTFWRWF